jgi:CheY-like chemotaxis protein
MKNKSFFLLVAEDDPDDRYILELLLKKNFPNWEYNISHNGQDLLTYVANLPENSPEISLIVLDINMPLKDGIETLKELRTNPKYKQLPIVGFSTAQEKTIMERFLKAGGTLYLQKPDRLSDIESVILRLPEIAEFKI